MSVFPNYINSSSVWLLIFIIGLILFYIFFWVKGMRLKKELKGRSETSLYENVKTFRATKRWFAYRGWHPMKIDVIVYQNTVYFLPRRLSPWLLTYPVPGSVSVHCKGVEVKPLYEKTLYIKYSSDCLKSPNLTLIHLNEGYEVSLTFENVEQRDDAHRKLNKEIA